MTAPRTRADVIARLEQAADVERRTLGRVGPAPVRSGHPAIVREYWDAGLWNTALKPAAVTAWERSRADEAEHWLAYIEKRSGYSWNADVRVDGKDLKRRIRISPQMLTTTMRKVVVARSHGQTFTLIAGYVGCHVLGIGDKLDRKTVSRWYHDGIDQICRGLGVRDEVEEAVDA